MKKISLFLLMIVLSINVCFACINDTSTHFFERQRFPSEEELIENNFYTHSKSFHEFRIKDRLEKLKKDKDNPALYDDLSVSYEKTGQTQKAIDTLKPILEKYPERYETLANLGTFYIHHGEYLKGLELLKKAIKINPQAHFGREIYQIKIVEYLLENGGYKTFPLQKNKDFADYILKNVAKEKEEDELIRAIVGVSGMLKFGNNDSPILLEALGDLYNRIYQDYVWYKNRDNPIGNISVKFYSAAYLRSIYKTISNDKSLDKQQEFFEKWLSQKNNKLSIPFSHGNGSLNMLWFEIDNANKYKERNEETEQTIIQNNSNPEQAIYKIMYAKPETQEDLFSAKKKQINDIISKNYQELIDDTADVILNVTGLITALLLFIGYILSIVSFNILAVCNIKSVCTSKEKYVIYIGALIFDLTIALPFIGMLIKDIITEKTLFIVLILYVASLISYIIYYLLFTFSSEEVKGDTALSVIKTIYKMLLWSGLIYAIIKITVLIMNSGPAIQSIN